MLISAFNTSDLVGKLLPASGKSWKKAGEGSTRSRWALVLSLHVLACSRLCLWRVSDMNLPQASLCLLSPRAYAHEHIDTIQMQESEGRHQLHKPFCGALALNCCNDVASTVSSRHTIQQKSDNFAMQAAASAHCAWMVGWSHCPSCLCSSLHLCCISAHTTIVNGALDSLAWSI